MRLLCDQNVAVKYVRAFENHDELVVTTVAEELSPDVILESPLFYAAVSRDAVVNSTKHIKNGRALFKHISSCLHILTHGQ